MPNQATASNLSFYNIFVQQKFLFRKFLMTSLLVIFGFRPPNPGYTYARGMAFRAVSPQITASATQARVNFCSSTTSKLLPKNRQPQTLFAMKQQNRSSERNQVALDFAMKTFFIFLVFTSKFQGKIHTKERYHRIRSKYSPNCCRIPNSSGLGCVSFPPPKFLCPLPQTHYSGSVPDTVLFYSQCTIYTVVCDQIANKSSSFVLLNASILRSLRSASF